MGMRLSEAALMAKLQADKIVSLQQTEQVRQMQKLIAGPLDRLLLQLDIVSRKQLWEGLHATSGLDVTSNTREPSEEGISELLAPGFADRTGIFVSEIRVSGPVFGLRQLPCEADLAEIFERCDSAGATFELEARS